MSWKALIRVAVLLSFSFLASAHWATAASVTEVPQAPSTTEETTEAETNNVFRREYISPCYVEKSKISELMIRMNQTVQILNRNDAYLVCPDSPEKPKIVEIDADKFELCSEERISQIQKDFNEVVAKLLQLAFRLKEPSKAEVLSLDRKKFVIIDRFKALKVFYGSAPCDSSTIVLYPFESLIDYVEYNLDQVLVLFQTARPSRPPTTTSTTPEPTTTTSAAFILNKMLNPSKSFQELTTMARSNPDAMTKALPGIISQRYNASAGGLNFDAVLSFVEGLPTTENRIIGFSAMYDDMQRHAALPALPQLLKLAGNVKRLNDSAVSTSPAFVGSAAWSKLTQIVHGLSPLILIGKKRECQIMSVAYQQQLFITEHGYPQSGYVASNSSGIYWIKIYPKIISGKIVFRLERESHTVAYASDTNSNKHSSDTIYQVKPSERYLLEDDPSRLPSNAEIDWKIVPEKHIPGQYRILSAKYDDFMFVHKSATGFLGWNRVLLGRKSYSNHDHIPNADLWTFHCKPVS